MEDYSDYCRIKRHGNPVESRVPVPFLSPISIQFPSSFMDVNWRSLVDLRHEPKAIRVWQGKAALALEKAAAEAAAPHLASSITSVMEEIPAKIIASVGGEAPSRASIALPTLTIRPAKPPRDGMKREVQVHAEAGELVMDFVRGMEAGAAVRSARVPIPDGANDSLLVRLARTAVHCAACALDMA